MPGLITATIPKAKKTATSLRLNAEHKYTPYGIAAKIQDLDVPELLVSGPAGTGKSRACLEKLHTICQDNAGVRCLIVRKTRESLSESALFTFEEHVLGPSHPLKDGTKRRIRQVYHYPNGSEIVVGGMDKYSKIMSTEFDLIYVQEATELEKTDWEALTTRLRNGKYHYQQLIADCNPEAPGHWLKVRCDSGRTLLLDSDHKDNPVLWDQEKQEWTKKGKAYIAKLDALTGAEKDRLRYGKWVQGTGVVYSEWVDKPDDPDNSNVTYNAEYDPNLDVYWTVDNGYSGEEDENGDFTPDSHPLAILFYHLLDNGDMLIFDELYRIRLQPEEVIREALHTKPYPKPRQAIVDKSAAALKDRLYDDFGIYYISSQGFVDEGIKKTRSWIKPDQNGHRRLKVNPRCRHLRKEFVSYVYGKDGKPKKANDHGPDIVRYACVEHS